MRSKKNIFKKLATFWKKIGPGLVTGASDNDPSGIATYPQAGGAAGCLRYGLPLLRFLSWLRFNKCVQELNWLLHKD